jgi:hypothetical protein
MAPKSDYGMIFGVGIRPLKEAFPVLFGIACINDASIATRRIFWTCHSVKRELY